MDERDLSESDNQELRHRQVEAEEFDEKENVDTHEVPEVSVSETSEQNDPQEEAELIPPVPLAPPRNLQPLQRPSFIARQFRSVKNFFIELIDFIFLFLTTLFNPMADVNTQVQEHNQRRAAARNGRAYSSCKPTSFPGCGPSS